MSFGRVILAVLTCTGVSSIVACSGATQENVRPTASAPVPPPVGLTIPDEIQDFQLRQAALEKEIEALRVPAHEIKTQGKAVASVAISPDESLLAAGYVDHSIHLFSMEHEKELRVLEGHTDPVLSVSFSPDGKKLLSGGGLDRTLIVWDVATGKIEGINTQRCGVVSARFLPDSIHFVSPCGDSIRLWTLGKDGDQPITVPGASFMLLDVAADGKVVAASGDGTVVLCDPLNGRVLKSHKRALQVDPGSGSKSPNFFTGLRFFDNDRVYIFDSQAMWAWDLKKDEIAALIPVFSWHSEFFGASRVSIGAFQDSVIFMESGPYYSQFSVLRPNEIVSAITASPKGGMAAVARGGQFSATGWTMSKSESIMVYDSKQVERSFAKDREWGDSKRTLKLAPPEGPVDFPKFTGWE